MTPTNIQHVGVLGGGSAGLIAALTLQRKLPNLRVTVWRSPDIGIIGVGEGTTAAFPRHFFEQLRLQPKGFYAEAQPTWKLGIKFHWGPRSEFYYSFAQEYVHQADGLSRGVGFYLGDGETCSGAVSALMAKGRAFLPRADGQFQWHSFHAFHIENVKLVAWLEKVCRELGVEIVDGTVRPEVGEGGVAALLAEDGRRLTADLYVDASGFRAELLGGALREPFLSYADSLFCDRAVIAGWPRTDEPIQPYTVAETMDHGWCWQIEHEPWINRGYVYGSAFVSDDEALREFHAKNPRLANDPRVVKFRSGRRARMWVDNVVAVGNAAGFVEPLEATALQVICVEALTLADTLADSLGAPTPTLVDLYNAYNTRAWDDIRDFLAAHYKFNTRLETPFWRACRSDTQLHGAEFMVNFYRENGPSLLSAQALHPSNSFGVDGYLALLLGMKVPHQKPYAPPPKEAVRWRQLQSAWAQSAERALDVKRCLDIVRRPGMKWE